MSQLQGGGGGAGTGAKSGEVASWNEEKGFGFVKPDDEGEDLFVHMSQLQGGLKGLGKGDKVKYDDEWDDMKSKYKAVNVSCADCSYRGGGGDRGGKGKGRGKYDDRGDRGDRRRSRRQGKGKRQV